MPDNPKENDSLQIEPQKIEQSSPSIPKANRLYVGLDLGTL
jgi:hypothetical protein